MRRLTEQILGRNGYVVTQAGSAEEAQEIFDDRQGGFDLVFTDLVLPRENGIALVERLLEQKPELRVLLTSGYSDAAGLETIRRKRYPFLTKPYSLQSVLEKLDEMLSQA